MKTMADKLKEFLATQSKEDILKDWSEIEALGFEGPSAVDYINYIEQQPIVSKPNYGVDFGESLDFDIDDSTPDYSFAA